MFLKIFNLKGRAVLSLYVLPVLICTLTSCDQPLVSREYEEIVIESPQKNRIGMQSDPHSFMENAPFAGIPGAAETNDQMTQKMLNNSLARPALTWKTPEGWREQKGSGLRLVTFQSEEGKGKTECSIISLSGSAGGLQSNVRRWMGQIGINASSDELDKILSDSSQFKSDGGIPMTIVDLTPLSRESQSPSMIAAVMLLDDMTIFVKMTGTREAVNHNHEQFKALCRSLDIN